MKLAAVAAAVTATLAFALGVGAGRTTAPEPDPITNPALAAAVTAKPFNQEENTVGDVNVQCLDYTSDERVAIGTAMPKAGDWYVRACTVTAVSK